MIGDWKVRSHRLINGILIDVNPQLASIFLVNVGNVGSNQMHQIRVALRGKAVVLMGKNTMVRRALRTVLSDSPSPPLRQGQHRIWIHRPGFERNSWTHCCRPHSCWCLCSKRCRCSRQQRWYGTRINLFLPDSWYPHQDRSWYYWNCIWRQSRHCGYPCRTFRSYSTEHVKYLSIHLRDDHRPNLRPRNHVLASWSWYWREWAYWSLPVGYQDHCCYFVGPCLPTVVNAYKNLIAISLATEYTFDGSEKVSNLTSCPYD